MCNSKENARDFKGVWIPKKVYLDERLTPLEKMILVEIDSHDFGEGCISTNNQLADFCQCTVRKISECISKLCELDYIMIKEQKPFRIIKSLLENKVVEKNSTPMEKNSTPMEKNSTPMETQQNNILNNIYNIYNKDNNIYSDNNNINNILKYNNTSFSKEKEEIYIKEKKDSISQKKEKSKTENLVEKVVEYLNEKLGTRYSPKTKNTIAHINVRISEGNGFEEFKTVIDNKYNDWYGTDYEKFLRPDTLFGSKFENYLNQRPKTKVNNNNFGGINLALINSK